MAVVWIPSLLQRYTEGASKVRASGSTLRQVMKNLDERYPGLTERLLDEQGQLQPEFAVAIDGETTHLGMVEPVGADSEVHFIPAISGGSR